MAALYDERGGGKRGGREGGRESMLGKEALQAPSRRSKEDKKKKKTIQSNRGTKLGPTKPTVKANRPSVSSKEIVSQLGPIPCLTGSIRQGNHNTIHCIRVKRDMLEQGHQMTESAHLLQGQLSPPFYLACPSLDAFASTAGRDAQVDPVHS